MFNPHLSHGSAMGRRAAAAVVASAAVVPVGVLLLVTPSTWAAATSAGTDAGAMLAGLAAVAGWVVALRLSVTAVAVAAAALPGGFGRWGRKVATAWSPALARGMVRVALGVAVATGPLIAQGAASADPPGYPTLDRINSGPAMTPAPAAPAAPAAPPSRPRRDHPGATVGSADQGAGHVVLVRPGDTLWGIAAAHLPAGHSQAQVAQAWPRWYEANRQSIGPDPDQIRAGTRLVPPSPST